MTRGEAEALVASAPKARLCARRTRDANRVTVTADDQPGVQLIWRRASPIANALVSAMLAMAAAPEMTKAAAEVGSQSASIASVTDGPDARTDSQSAAGSISGRVVDPSGAVIPGATLMLLDEDTGEAQTTVSSGDGTFRFFVKTDGLYMLTTEREGFRSVEETGLNLAIGQDNQLDITMEVRLTSIQVAGCGGARLIITLRGLCAASDRIVVARPTRSVKIKSDGASHLTRTSLIVSSTLKGEGNERLVNVYHFVKGDPEQGHFPRGEHLLFFLKHRATSEDPQSAGGYELAEYWNSVRKLPSSELDVYVQRIIELTLLSREEEPNPEATVEWLVRCVEDPATRWEGAFDLAPGSESFPASSTQNDSDEGSVDEINQSSEAPGSANNVELAALLTQDQKERLLKVLISADEVTEAERDLIDLLKDFNDPRLLSFLVSQLRRTEEKLFLQQVERIMKGRNSSAGKK